VLTLRFGCAGNTEPNAWQTSVFPVSLTRMKREIELFRLKRADGGRISPLSEPRSGLCLEKRLDPQDSLSCQKEGWKPDFAALLERALETAR
jgi:hypothetical protein